MGLPTVKQPEDLMDLSVVRGFRGFINCNRVLMTGLRGGGDRYGVALCRWGPMGPNGGNPLGTIGPQHAAIGNPPGSPPLGPLSTL